MKKLAMSGGKDFLLTMSEISGRGESLKFVRGGWKENVDNVGEGKNKLTMLKPNWRGENLIFGRGGWIFFF